ncbi:glutathione S-transferase [Pseudooceanicola sediminis]|uniref:Glutathione S-transferase n=2 Tax=Pseudooceanicola sediminis TaxID=2211117 RepID=A0A399J0V0_9RHOB|nr:glutathione S-transferase [Puniceibacterium sp. HSS470]RII39043.1 glutathione S-transferase [Pseudooceanicola sediminis]
MKLYDFELHAECYAARLMLSLLGVTYQTEAVDFYPEAAHLAPEFRAINPLGRLPLLEDGTLRFGTVQGILSYLAAAYDPTGHWAPDTAVLRGEVAGWMAVAGELAATAGQARLIETMFADGDAEAARAGAEALLRVIDQHLWFGEVEGRDWLCSATHPTIADIACFPHVVLSEDGGISRQDYPAIRRWIDRVKRLEGFTVMSGVFPTSSAL